MAQWSLEINGKTEKVIAEAATALLWVLREDLQLTGAKYGCGEGSCGACTVLVDGKAERSCLLPVSSLKGKKIQTIEGLSRGEQLHPVQQAFLDEEAFQCGFCTPGMILSSVALLSKTAKPSREAVRQNLNGHVCRCGSYPRILAAVELAARGGKR